MDKFANTEASCSANKDHDRLNTHNGTYCYSAIETLNDTNLVCCETVDFDEFKMESISPSLTNMLDTDVDSGIRYTRADKSAQFLKDGLNDSSTFIRMDEMAGNTGQVCFEGHSQSNKVELNHARLTNQDDRLYKAHKVKNSQIQTLQNAETGADTLKTDLTFDGVAEDERETCSMDESDNGIDASAGLRNLLQKLFCVIKRYVPIKSRDIQELLERTAFTSNNIANENPEKPKCSSGEYIDTANNQSALVEFEAILQKLFQDFQEEWLTYQTHQEKKMVHVFLRGVQAARQQSEIETAEARNEVLKRASLNMPAIVNKSSVMIKELQRERSVLAKYIIEKQNEWNLIRESLVREISTLRKDNTRLLSNKVSSLNTKGQEKGTNVTPFNQRTLESMVHAKYSLEKALMLDVSKQSKINELSLIIRKQQEQIRELQGIIYDKSSQSLTDKMGKPHGKQQTKTSTTKTSQLSDEELLDYIIKDMTSRVLNRDNEDNIFQVLYCDDDYYLPHTATSADLATLRLYCLGGTWRTNMQCPKLNPCRQCTEDENVAINQQCIPSMKESGEGDINSDKGADVTTIPTDNTSR